MRARPKRRRCSDLPNEKHNLLASPSLGDVAVPPQLGQQDPNLRLGTGFTCDLQVSWPSDCREFTDREQTVSLPSRR